MGSPNVLDARVQASADADGLHRLNVQGGGWSGTALASRSYGAGEGVHVMVRPENLRLAGAAPVIDTDLTLKGTVTDLVFRGAVYSVTIAVASMHLTLELPSATTVAIGDELDVYVPQGTAWALDATAAG